MAKEYAEILFKTLTKKNLELVNENNDLEYAIIKKKDKIKKLNSQSLRVLDQERPSGSTQSPPETAGDNQIKKSNSPPTDPLPLEKNVDSNGESIDEKTFVDYDTKEDYIER